TFQDQILVQAVENDAIVLRTVSPSEAASLKGESGRPVVLEPGSDPRDWQPGAIGYVRFQGTVKKVTPNSVYVETPSGTVMVPKRGAQYAPSTSSGTLAGSSY